MCGLCFKDPNVSLRKASVMACASLASVRKSVLKDMGSADESSGMICVCSAAKYLFWIYNYPLSCSLCIMYLNVFDI